MGDGKKYLKSTLRLLTGREDFEKGDVSEGVLLVAEAVENPFRLPFLLEGLRKLDSGDEDLRYALLRVQIDAELKMNEDLQSYQRRRYVARVIEKLIYGELMLEVGEGDIDDCED